MKIIRKKTVLLMLLTAAVLLCHGCSTSTLSKSNPVEISIWHVYGAQSSSPMDDLIDEFNATEGSRKGVIVNTERITSTYKLQEELLAAQAGTPGAGDMPDLFNSTARFAKALGTENLTNWEDYFSAEELDHFVESFIADGTTDGRLTVLPFTKSTHVCFINTALFHRFSEACNVTLDDLADWEGFFAAAEKYYAWSGGKPFCALDYPLLAAEMNARELGDTAVYDDSGWYDASDEMFQDSWRKFAEEIGKGCIALSDPFGSENVMTGEVCCSMGSSAGILYYNDVVTYEDGTTEPLSLTVISMPHAAGGTPLMAYTGVGISAVASDSRAKAEAASVFVHWLTEPERNLEFCTRTGYIPARIEALEQLSAGYQTENENYQSLYAAIGSMYDTCTPFSESHDPSYTEKLNSFYGQLRQMQSSGDINSPEGFATKSLERILSYGTDTTGT